MGVKNVVLMLSKIYIWVFLGLIFVNWIFLVLIVVIIKVLSMVIRCNGLIFFVDCFIGFRIEVFWEFLGLKFFGVWIVICFLSVGMVIFVLYFG